MSKKRFASDLREEFLPKQVRPLIDTREQLPWSFPELGEATVTTFDVGDYSYAGGECLCRIERKSGPDFLGSIFEERFEREMERIRVYPCHALIIEGSWEWLESGVWRIKATSKQVTGKLLGMIEMGVNVILSETRERAEQIAARLMFISARRRWRELRALASSVGTESEVNA